jgi:hypothetical protein
MGYGSMDSLSLARTTTRGGLFENCSESLRSIKGREYFD